MYCSVYQLFTDLYAYSFLSVPTSVDSLLHVTCLVTENPRDCRHSQITAMNINIFVFFIFTIPIDKSDW